MKSTAGSQRSPSTGLCDAGTGTGGPLRSLTHGLGCCTHTGGCTLAGTWPHGPAAPGTALPPALASANIKTLLKAPAHPAPRCPATHASTTWGCPRPPYASMDPLPRHGLLVRRPRVAKPPLLPWCRICRLFLAGWCPLLGRGARGTASAPWKLATPSLALTGADGVAVPADMSLHPWPSKGASWRQLSLILACGLRKGISRWRGPQSWQGPQDGSPWDMGCGG